MVVRAAWALGPAGIPLCRGTITPARLRRMTPHCSPSLLPVLLAATPPHPQAASDIVSSQGWRGLYRGNALNVLRSAPQKALDFFAFDAFKRLLGDDTHAKTFLAAGGWCGLRSLAVDRVVLVQRGW